MRSLPPARIQLRIRCRCRLVATRFHRVSCGDKISSCLLWRQDFILSGKCKLKTCTHMGKLAPTWENLHPHGTTCTHKNVLPQKAWNAALFGLIHASPRRVQRGGTSTPEREHQHACTTPPETSGHRGRAPSAQALLPTDSAEEPGCQDARILSRRSNPEQAASTFATVGSIPYPPERFNTSSIGQRSPSCSGIRHEPVVCHLKRVFAHSIRR